MLPSSDLFTVDCFPLISLKRIELKKVKLAKNLNPETFSNFALLAQHVLD
jgi:hypothetical protein